MRGKAKRLSRRPTDLRIKEGSSRRATGWLATFVVASGAVVAGARAEEPPRFNLQSTSDFASYGAFYGDFTATYSPFGNLWDRGWRLQGVVSARRFSSTDGGQKRVGLDATLDMLGGYQFTPHGWSWIFSAGPTFVNSHLYSAAGLPQSNTFSYGLKFLTSLYGKPSSNTMIYVQAHYNTASDFYYLQGKTGVAIAPNLFVGPEVAFSGSWIHGYDQTRLGGHLTGFTLAGFNTGVSAGYVQDSGYGKGFYAGVNVQNSF
jgi:hypothetical protein